MLADDPATGTSKTGARKGRGKGCNTAGTTHENAAASPSGLLTLLGEVVEGEHEGVQEEEQENEHHAPTQVLPDSPVRVPPSPTVPPPRPVNPAPAPGPELPLKAANVSELIVGRFVTILIL